MKIVKIGDPLPHTQDRNTVPTIEGTTTVFPIRDDGLEMNWGVTRETLKRLIDNHVVQISPNKNSQYQPYTIKYLSENYQEKIASGRWAVRGYREDGSKIVVETGGKVTRATTVWKETRYDAKTYGTVLLKNIIGDARFSFPKSLYSVADTLRYFVMDKPDALIIDFFAGSGTTLHAVNLLNAEDGGHRRCVIVTNNEVSDTEAKEMTKRGLKPGDEEWEALGIARYVTWPRTVCAIEGHDVNGNPLKGNYLGSDIPMSDGFNSNAIYFKLGFLDKTAVALGMQFKEMLPVLWMKAGAIGKCPEVIGTVPDMLILPGNRFAVLINENAFAAFEEAVNNTPEIQTVFIVTDYEVNYRAMIKNLTVEASYQLYRDYLDNFRINHGRN
jgi:adenine-specific DNA-methyltransferase